MTRDATLSPARAADNSPGRQPWGFASGTNRAPEGRQRTRLGCGSRFLSPLTGLWRSDWLFPRLKPWASLYRLFEALSLAGALTAPAEQPAVVYVSDHPDLILASTQDWGTLGFDVAAHQPDQEGLPLQIGDKTYAKGLGHHANGAITILLDGQYARFEAEVGLQPCPGGSVVFRVVVDGQPRFASGVMKSGEAPKPVLVTLTGAQELRLEATAAGDGISCDMANWAEARLTPASGAASAGAAGPRVDIARFACVVTWDPNRLDGARASRIEEFRAGDVFLETDVPPATDGAYTVPVSANGLACLGLQWLNRRALAEVSLEFADPASAPPTAAVRVEGWFGESAWQGHWQPLAGSLNAEGGRLVFRLATKAGVVQTQKLRWIWPASPARVAVRGLSAFTRSRWDVAKLFVQIEKPANGVRGQVRVANGEFPAQPPSHQPTFALDRWELARPLHLRVRYSRPSLFNSDPTVLEFRLPSGACGVAVADVLSNDCVYVPDFGLFVAREPVTTSLAAYRARIAGRQTILQQVRVRPDQTLAQAMGITHHDAQRDGPVMLSLAADNAKFVEERDGMVRFQATATTNSDWFATAGELRPHFGQGSAGSLTRHLDGGWLPIPVIRVTSGGVVYSERAFVAPADEAGERPTRLNRRSVCVVEFDVKNATDTPARAALDLAFLSRSREKIPAEWAPCARGLLLRAGGASIGLVTTNGAGPLVPEAGPGRLTLTGTLPPGGEARCVVHLSPQSDDLLRLPDDAALRRAVEAYWQAVLAPALQVETPDPRLNDLIRSAQVRCLIAARNEADGARIAPWIAAMSYGPLESEAHSVIRGLDFLGHAEFAQRGLDFFIHRYNTNGFLTTGYTTFGTAWHLWTLGEHWQLTRDTNWLRRVAPEVTRVGEWIVRQLEKTKRDAAFPGVSPTFAQRQVAAGEDGRAPEYGLMPPGVLADWNAFAWHFTLNAYYYAALRQLGAALTDLGDVRGVLFTQRAAELRGNLLRAYAWTQARSPVLPLRNGTWIPAYPSQVHSPGKLGDFFPGQDAGRSWCYDVELGAQQLVATGVLEPRSREVERMMDHLEDVQFLADGWFDYPAAQNRRDWFDLGGFSKVQPYYTRNCEIDALRDDVKPFLRSYFNTLAAMLNPEVLTFWEHFHHGGAWDKTHETGYFLHQTRTMLLTERGDELWLAPLIPTHWLADGMELAVSNAPTRFGKTSYRITSHAARGDIEAVIQPPVRQPPAALVLRLRHPDGRRLRAVTLNGTPHRDFDPARNLIRLPPLRQELRLRAEF